MKTRIGQRHTSNIEEAPRLLTNSSADEQVVMVMIREPCCCCELKMNIPSGLTTLEETCGKNTGIMQPGAKWCYCRHQRVACMVSQAMIQYNAPVRNCPTKDNAYISIDLYFTFRLPRTEPQIQNFVYKLGAARFDELIEAEIEEGVRSFINGIWLSQVFDLKEEMTKKFKDELNKRF